MCVAPIIPTLAVGVYGADRWIDTDLLGEEPVTLLRTRVFVCVTQKGIKGSCCSCIGSGVHRDREGSDENHSFQRIGASSGAIKKTDMFHFFSHALETSERLVAYCR